LLYASFFREQPKVSHLPFFFWSRVHLVETKAITELGLTFGNTWQVIAIAIASILIMAFMANGIVHRYAKRTFRSISCCLRAWLRLVDRTSEACPRQYRENRTAHSYLPLFFSGIVFSTLLSASPGFRRYVNESNGRCAVASSIQLDVLRLPFLYLLAIGLYAAPCSQAWRFAARACCLPLKGERSDGRDAPSTMPAATSPRLSTRAGHRPALNNRTYLFFCFDSL